MTEHDALLLTRHHTAEFCKRVAPEVERAAIEIANNCTVQSRIELPSPGRFAIYYVHTTDRDKTTHRPLVHCYANNVEPHDIRGKLAEMHQHMQYFTDPVVLNHKGDAMPTEKFR